jgi:PAS domain-containing protein
MTRGEASWHEDQLVPIYRDGKLHDVYWTYSYSPVRDPEGRICGTLVTCSETTKRKHLELERASLIKELEQERAQLTDLFQQAPAFFAVLRGAEHVFEMTNPLYQELIGRRNLIGKAAREAIPEADGQGFSHCWIACIKRASLSSATVHRSNWFGQQASPLKSDT